MLPNDSSIAAYPFHPIQYDNRKDGTSQIQENPELCPNFAPVSQWHFWKPILHTAVPFGLGPFKEVMINLIKNPNLTSSHVFRAEVWWDSAVEFGDNGNINDDVHLLSRLAPGEHKDDTVLTYGPQGGDRIKFDGDCVQSPGFSASLAQMRTECRPWTVAVPRPWVWERTWVRRMVPRNPGLDKFLTQSCHLFRLRKEQEKQGQEGREHIKSLSKTRRTGECADSVYIPQEDGLFSGGDGYDENLERPRSDDDDDEWDESTIMMYVPHIEKPGKMPFYHPDVAAVAFEHRWNVKSQKGKVGIWYRFFDSNPTMKDDQNPKPSITLPATARDPISNRMIRTANHLLRIIHKHGTGRMTNYRKRVQHDLVVPQSRFQDRYTQLKMKYAKGIIESWVEDTPASKHVFEDLGVAAFLICLWLEWYDCSGLGSDRQGVHIEGPKKAVDVHGKVPFPGFVDIACGNGLLVYILIQEGWPGYGFDARRRKSWAIYPDQVQSCLREELFVPRTFSDSISSDETKAKQNLGDEAINDGIFPTGTFIISNHADELTTWTPLLAYLNGSDFVAIPCCSHDFSGTRTRFQMKSQKARKSLDVQSASTGNQVQTHLRREKSEDQQPQSGDLKVLRNRYGGKDSSQRDPTLSNGDAASNEIDSKKGKPNQPKQPSAYATLTAYVEDLSRELDFIVEREMLRIPSTRNAAVVGRPPRESPNPPLENSSNQDLNTFMRLRTMQLEDTDPKEPEDLTDRSSVDGSLMERLRQVQRIVEKELCEDAKEVGKRWIERARKIQKTKGTCH